MSCTSPLPFAASGISVLVPVYNEAPGVRWTLTQLGATMRSLGWPYELLVIDDGSTDTSRQEIVCVDDPAIRVIVHPVNQGYGASLTDGLRQARYPSLVITDADRTYPIECIPDLIAGLDHHTMVVGARLVGKVHVATIRKPVKWCLRRLAEQITKQRIPDLNSGLRAMRRDAILPLTPILPQRFSWTSTVTVALLLCGEPIAFLPIAYHRRKGISKVHPFLDTLRALQCIARATAFGYTHRPNGSHATALGRLFLAIWIVIRPLFSSGTMER